MTNLIDKNKKYRLRCGHEARVLMTDGGDWGFPVIAAYKDSEGRWWPLHLTKDGRATPQPHKEDARDLVEIKPRIKREVWLNVYRNGVDAYSTRHSADYNTEPPRIACVKLTIDCEEGEGL